MKSFEHMAPTLKVLNLSQNLLGTQGAEHLAKLLMSMRGLKELYLKDCEIGDRGIAAVCGNLDTFNISLE